MNSPAQQKFDEFVKEAYWDTLKPLGYKKKANNFYISNGEIGKFINIQRSIYGTRDEIRFTINIGIFSPEYWNETYNRQNLPVPNFPTEPACILRERIGHLLGIGDIWYDLTDTIDLSALKNSHRDQINKIILPYFASINNNDDLIKALARFRWHQFILLGLLKRNDAARAVMQTLLNNNPSQHHQIMITEKAKEFGLI